MKILAEFRAYTKNSINVIHICKDTLRRMLYYQFKHEYSIYSVKRCFSIT